MARMYHPHCAVWTHEDPENPFALDVAEYERIKECLRAGPAAGQQWVEFRTRIPGGRVLLQPNTIACVLAVDEDYCRQAAVEDAIEGDDGDDEPWKR